MKKQLLALTFCIIGWSSLYSQTALNFDGTDDYVSAPNAGSLFEGSTTWTLEFKVATTTGGYAIGFNGQNYLLIHPCGMVIFYTQSGFIQSNCSVFPLDGNPHNIAVRSNGASNGSVFVDGNPVAMLGNSSTGLLGISTSPFNIGGTPAAGFCAATIDDVRMWNYARTNLEISSDKNSCLTGLEAGLILFYNLESVTGATMVCNKGQAGALYNGNLINMDPNTDFVTGYNGCTGSCLSCSFADQTVTATISTICPNTSTSIQIGSSETNISYTLIDASNSAILQGPTTGTGSSMSFNTGNLTSSTTFAINGYTNDAINLPGTSDHIRINNPFFAYSNTITVEAWIDFNSGQHLWAGQGTASVDNMTANVWLWHAGTFYVNDNGTWRSLNFPITVPTGKVHVATVADNTGMYIYYDGVLVASGTTPSSIIASGIRNNAGSVIDIGHDVRFPAGTPGRNTNFGIDNFTVWNTARSLIQIQNDMTDCFNGSEIGLVQRNNFPEGTGITTASVVGGSGLIVNPNGTNWVIGEKDCQSCNTELSTQVTVTVQDNTSPVISNCPSNQSANANTTGCSAIVSWTAPTAIDDCTASVNVTSTHNPGDSFSEGTTTVTYTFDDGNGNTSTCSFDVIVSNTMSPSSVEQMVSCNGGTNGAIDVTISGGNLPISFSWTGPNGFTATTEDISGLEAGQYFPSATDAAGCVISGTIDITEPAAISITVDGSSNPTACGAADGTALVTVTGGTIAGAYSFSWSDGGSYSSSVEDPTDMTAGTITLTVTDDNSCVATQSVSLSDPNGPSIALSSAAITDLDCFGDTDGEAQIDVTLNGGATSATYLWDDSSNSTTEDITGLGAGTYNVAIVDNNNCTAAFSVTITEPTELISVFSVSDITCNGDNDGMIDNTVTGGTPSYSFVWDDAATSTTEDISGLPAGTFTVIVTDGNGCTATNSGVIAEPAALTANGTSVDEIQGNDGTIDLTVTGGTSGFTYAWTGPNGFTGTTEDLTGLEAGTYNVTVTDANGCTTTASVTVGSQVGVDEISFSNFSLYPNPNTGIFFITSKDKSSYLITITDAAGRMVMSDKITGETTGIDLSKMERGIYFVTMRNENTV
jgi:uncharacterized protein (DUF2141 family)